MTFRVWEDEYDWKDLGGNFHVPKSFVAATCIFVVLGKGQRTPGGFSIPKEMGLGESIKELREILLSISGGADQIGKEENVALFKIDEITVLRLDTRIRRNNKEEIPASWSEHVASWSEEVEPWREHVDKGTYIEAGAEFGVQIIANNRSPYKIDFKDDKIQLIPDDDTQLIPNDDTRKKVLEEFANEWYARVRAKYFIVASTEEINADAGIPSGSG